MSFQNTPLSTPTNLGKVKMALEDDSLHNVTPLYSLELHAESNAAPPEEITPSHQKLVVSICNNSATKDGTGLGVVPRESGGGRKWGDRQSFTKRLWHATLSEF